MNQIIDNIRKRRSIRKNKDKAVPRKIIEEIIEAGRYAPSSHNSQPWRFVVVTNRKKIRELSDYIKRWFRARLKLGRIAAIFSSPLKEGIEKIKKRTYTEQDLFFYDAPLLVLICSKKGTFHIKDCSCASQNMFLVAKSLDIGSCWIGFADLVLSKSRRILTELGIPRDHELMATLIFGYAEKFPKQAFPRKEEAAIIKWIK